MMALPLQAEYLPSEVSRLVLGYLKETNCHSAWKSLLEESPGLHEYRLLYQQGRTIATNVEGLSLLDILRQYLVYKREAKNKPKKDNAQDIDLKAVKKTVVDEIVKAVDHSFEKYFPTAQTDSGDAARNDDQSSVSTNILQDSMFSHRGESSTVNASTSLGDVSKSLSICSDGSRHEEMRSKVICSRGNSDLNLNAEDTHPTGPNILKVFSLNGDVANNPALSNNDMATNITMNNNNNTGNSSKNTMQDTAIEITRKIEIPDVVIVNDAMSSKESTSVPLKNVIKDSLSASIQKNICKESGEVANKDGEHSNTMSNISIQRSTSLNEQANNIIVSNLAPTNSILPVPVMPNHNSNMDQADVSKNSEELLNSGILSSNESVGITLNSSGYQLTTVNNLPASTTPTYILSNMPTGNILTPDGSPYSFIMSAPINGMSVPLSAFPNIIQNPMPTVVPKPATASIVNMPAAQQRETSQAQGIKNFLLNLADSVEGSLSKPSVPPTTGPQGKVPIPAIPNSERMKKMKAAIGAVKGGLSINKSAIKYGIPRSTLRSHLASCRMLQKHSIESSKTGERIIKPKKISILSKDNTGVETTRNYSKRLPKRKLLSLFPLPDSNEKTKSISSPAVVGQTAALNLLSVPGESLKDSDSSFEILSNSSESMLSLCSSDETMKASSDSSGIQCTGYNTKFYVAKCINKLQCKKGEEEEELLENITEVSHEIGTGQQQEEIAKDLDGKETLQNDLTEKSCDVNSEVMVQQNESKSVKWSPSVRKSSNVKQTSSKNAHEYLINTRGENTSDEIPKSKESIPNNKNDKNKEQKLCKNNSEMNNTGSVCEKPSMPGLAEKNLFEQMETNTNKKEKKPQTERKSQNSSGKTKGHFNKNTKLKKSMPKNKICKQKNKEAAKNSVKELKIVAVKKYDNTRTYTRFDSESKDLLKNNELSHSESNIGDESRKLPSDISNPSHSAKSSSRVFWNSVTNSASFLLQNSQNDSLIELVSNDIFSPNDASNVNVSNKLRQESFNKSTVIKRKLFEEPITSGNLSSKHPKLSQALTSSPNIQQKSLSKINVERNSSIKYSNLWIGNKQNPRVVLERLSDSVLENAALPIFITDENSPKVPAKKSNDTMAFHLIANQVTSQMPVPKCLNSEKNEMGVDLTIASLEREVKTECDDSYCLNTTIPTTQKKDEMKMMISAEAASSKDVIPATNSAESSFLSLKEWDVIKSAIDTRGIDFVVGRIANHQ